MSEQFADSCGIAHLRQCFAELKELIRASLHPDLQQMAENANMRRSLFPRLDPLRLASLLEKVRQTDRQTAVTMLRHWLHHILDRAALL